MSRVLSGGFVGASRESYAVVVEQLEADVERISADELARLGDDVFAVTGVLHNEGALRRTLADPALPGSAKAGLVESLLGDRLGAASVATIREVVTARWSSPRDLIDAMDMIGSQAVLASAERAGNLDEVEDELFRFGRILDRETDLAVALADLSAPVDGRIRLLDDVLTDKVRPATRRLLEEAVAAPRGRSLDRAIDGFVRMAAERRRRLVAEVYSAVPLSPDQIDRLGQTLARMYGREIAVQSVVEPDLLGGLTIRIGDEVIDGSIASRLDLARRQLAE